MAEQKRLDVRLTLDRKAGGLKERQFAGHGAVFRNVDRGGDILVPGCFRKSLEEHRREGTWPSMLFGHDMQKIPGRWVEMYEDEKGLAVVGEFARTQLGDECRELIRSGSLGGLSIGYIAKTTDWDHEGRRLLREVDLLECSLVSIPMNPKATVTAAKIASVREWEAHLKSLFGRRAAIRLASKTWPYVACEAGGDPLQQAKDLQADADEQAAVAELLRSISAVRNL